MTRDRNLRARARARLVAFGAAGALVLAACGGPVVVAAAHYRGTPTITFSVPMTNVACTANDVCVAVGTTSADGGPRAVGEFASPHGNWFNLTLPAASAPTVTASACGGVTCLIGGYAAGRDLLWRFSATNHAVTNLAAPADGLAVGALNCASDRCALIDRAADATPRLSISADDGTTWQAPEALTWASGDVITALFCRSALDCLVSAQTSSHGVLLESTSDGGATWNARRVPTSWTDLTSLQCTTLNCVGLAQTSSSSLLVRSKSFGGHWNTTTLDGHATSLACSSLLRCVVVGKRSSGAAWLANVDGDTVTDAHLRYVPTPLVAAACGSKVCATIAVTTVVSLPLAP